MPISNMEGEGESHQMITSAPSILLIDPIVVTDSISVPYPPPKAKRPWSTRKKVCCCISLLLLAGLITIGALIPFMIKKPTVTVTSTQFSCPTPCTPASTITAQAFINVYNPDIISPTVSADLSLESVNGAKVYGPGTVPPTVVSRQGTTQLVATFVLAPSVTANAYLDLFLPSQTNAGGSQLRVTGTATVQVTSLIKPTVSIDETVNF